MENVTLDNAYEEAGKRYKDEESGGYDLMSIEAFARGAELAIKLNAEGMGPVNPNILAEGYKWAAEKLLE